MKTGSIRLTDRFTLWFIAIVFLVTPLCMMISYHDIKKNQLTAETKRLEEQNKQAAAALLTTAPVAPDNKEGTLWVQKLTTLSSRDSVNEKPYISITTNQHTLRLTVSNYYKVHQQYYRIRSYTDMAQVSQNWQTTLKVALWKILLIAIVAAITGRIISRHVLSPFYKTLDTINTFSLKQKQPIRFPDTSVAEFKQLNRFLTQMTDLAMEDYARIKEFSENASHEVQTPLAILQTKLELLTQSCSSDQQALLIMDMQQAVDKMGRINRSLLLLTRLENFEYGHTEKVFPGKVLKDVLLSFEDQLKLSNLQVSTTINTIITQQIHPDLLEILFRNLISNAIRYNIENGQLAITLSPDHFVIKNTGIAPDFDPELFFQRFKKSSQHSDSVGLGLSIVKQICILNNFPVSYTYNSGYHNIYIAFASLQNRFKVSE